MGKLLYILLHTRLFPKTIGKNICFTKIKVVWLPCGSTTDCTIRTILYDKFILSYPTQTNYYRCSLARARERERENVAK